MTKAEFETWKASRVTTTPGVLGGAPVFAGTRLSVVHVGILAQRPAGYAEVISDYPYLSSVDIEAAIYAVAGPDRVAT